jgi:tripartite ATP-independent transporter DctP family solute receptor
MHILIILTILAGLLSCADGEKRSGITQFKLGHVAGPDSLITACADEFARRVNEKLAGRAEVQVFGSSQLGNDETLLQKLKLGTVDFSLPSTIMSSTVDAFGLFEMPYLVRDREHMKRIAEAVFWPHMTSKAEERGYKILALWENGFRHITNSERPIVNPHDLAGIKLRTPRGRWRVKLFQTYGANPTPMPLSEVFVALQTGVMDGQENPLAQVWGVKLQEVQAYLSLTGHVYTPAYLVTSVEHWKRVPSDLRAELVAVARGMQEFVYRTAEQMDAELLSKLEATGMKVNQADTKAFQQAGKPIYEEFSATVPDAEDWIQTVLALGES